MRVVAGSASVFQRGMYIFLLKKAAVMTAKTGFFNRGFQQERKKTVVRLMTTAACSGSHGLMNGLSGWRGFQPFMTGITEFRFLLTEKKTTDEPMGQVAAIATVFFHRRMNITVLIGIPHFRMAVQAASCRGLIRFLPGLHTGNDQQDRQQSQKKNPYNTIKFFLHPNVPSLFSVVATCHC